MLNAVIRYSLRYRSLVITLAAVLLGCGGYLATRLPVDVFPDLDRPRVVIITECSGLATEEVETLVTRPIEVAILGAAGVQAVRSQTTSGLNVIYVEFSWETEIKAARQTVQERLSTLTGNLPDGIRPQMAPPASIMGQIVIAGMYRQKGPNGGDLTPITGTSFLAERIRKDGVPAEINVWDPRNQREPSRWKTIPVEACRWEEPDSSGKRASEETVQLVFNHQEFRARFAGDKERLMDLRTLADWVVRPQLLKIPGVAEVFIQGGERKQYHILVNPAALLEYEISLQQVEDALKESNVNTSGGFAIQGESERAIRVLGRLGPEPDRVIQDLRKVPLKSQSVRPILLEDVAQVSVEAQFKRGDGSINGIAGTVFTIVKQPHVDTRQLTRALSQTLQDLEQTLPLDIAVRSDLFQLKGFIDRGIFNVTEALVIGAILVFVVLFLFLANFRTTFITLTAIPLSLVMTTLVFRIFGVLSSSQLSINVMTLGGIAVAMGELVDDAIVDVENIYRRLKENQLRESPQSTLRVIFDASVEIRSAIVFGTAVVILVFVPLFALSGIEGRLFRPLAIAYIVSILASLVVSLTVTPVLSYYLLANSHGRSHKGDGPLLKLLKWVAAPFIRLSLRSAGWLLLITWLLVGFSAWQLSRMGRNFLPPFDEGSIQVNLTLPPGSSLDASNQIAGMIDEKFRERQKSAEHPQGEILNFVRRTGRAEMDEHAAPVNTSEYILSMNPLVHRSREVILAELLEELREEVPGVAIEVEQPLAHLISHMVSGVYAQIAIKIVGDDLDTLLGLAEQTRQAITDVAGLTPPIIEPIQPTPELHIRLLRDELARYGMTRAYLGKVLQTALQGEIVSAVLDGERRFDLLVRLQPASRTDYANLGRLRVDLPDGSGQVELGSVAEISEGIGPSAVNRENARRRIIVRCNTQGRDLSSAVADIESRVRKQVQLPQGYFIEYSGQFENQRRATILISFLAGISIAAMFVVLLVLYPSFRIALQILNALPTAFIGGVWALVLTGQSLSVASLVGFISLGGIAVRNGILLVTHYFHLMKEEGEAFSPAMILRGSLERLAPVLMTALTAGIGLLPLVLGGGEPGREILYPVATVILGGLITSTLCEFLIHPGLFWRFSGKDTDRILSSTKDEW